MAEAKIFRVIREQREAVNRDEKTVLLDLARRWVPAQRYLNQQINNLMKAIVDLMQKGEPVPISYVHSLDRYRKMADAAFRQIDRYNQAAAKVITGAEADAQEIGSSNARQLISLAAGDSPFMGLSPTIAVPTPDDPLWTRVNTRETRILSGMMSEGSPLYQLLRKSYAQTMDEIDKALTIGMSTGQGSSWIANQLSEAAHVPLERALVIARTEVNRAYREANLETMRESSAVKGYRRMCYPPTACFACLMLDGEYYDKLESFSDHPNGKCSAVPVTKHFDPINSPGWERGRDWFMEQDEATQRKLMGPARFDLWKQQGVDPRDMVYIKPNQTWGGSPAVKTLENLRSFPGVSLHQEGSDPQIPKSIEGDFSDFDPLEIDNETRKIFEELHSLEQQDHNEHAQIISEIDKSDILSSEKFDKVEIDLGLCKGDHLRIYHSHTNLTPPSTPDLRKLCTPRVDEIGNIAINGDTFIVRIGDGIKPNLSEFDEAAKQIQNEVTKDLMKDPNFFDWSKEEKDYMYIREKFYRIAREFGWQMEGGNIDEQ